MSARSQPSADMGTHIPCSPLVCDLCEWPMAASEIVRLPDGAIPGLLTCSLCVEDALATRTLELTS